MMLLVSGLILFIGVHLFTALARGQREALISKVGLLGYKGGFAIASLIGLILIIKGWKAAGAGADLYALPDVFRSFTYILVWLAFILMAAAYLPAGKIAAATKHPMLVGVKVWAVAHLLVNSDPRSLILFGSVLAWAVINRIAYKKRGDHGRPAGSAMYDAIAVLIGTAGAAAVFVWLHVYLAGVSLHANAG